MKMTDIHSPEPGNLAGAATVTTSETVGTKRQRRPSVRLGEIGGDQFYETHHQQHSRRLNNGKQWKNQQSFNFDSRIDVGISQKASKTRALTNLSSCSDVIGGSEFLETLGEGKDKDLNLDSVAIGSWKVKDCKKRASNAAAKRVRSSWVSKVDDGGVGVGGSDNNVGGDDKFSGGEYLDGSYRDFDRENSESPVREHSPGHSIENLGDGNERSDRDVYFSRRAVRGIENRNFNDGVELSGPSDAEAREYRNGDGSGEDGVRIWLNSIGLGRYAPVFEIHEVDDEVLPLLTLEDLKDMGISAVGSRRKMFCAIQKLGKGFS